MITFGLSGFGLTLNEACIIQNNGRIVFNGKTSCGGTRVSCNHGGVITFGKDVVITGRCLIVSSKRIAFGDDCLISWNTQFMDTDLHGLTIDDGTNLCKEICVGKHVWVCSNVTVKKGAFIPSGCVLGSDTLVSKEFSEEKWLFRGNGG